jgi:hypothetical protein
MNAENPMSDLFSVWFWRTAAALTLVLMSACATMSPEQCQSADWGVVGMRDGQNGAATTLLDNRLADCAKVGVKINVDQYLRARDVGLQTYCRIETAAQRGLDGAGYAGVCPPGIDGEFRRRHAIGREFRDAREQVRYTRGRREALERRLREANSEDDRRRARGELEEADYAVRRAMDRQFEAERRFDYLRSTGR